MGELRDYLHHPTPDQNSGELEEIIDRYGLSRGERWLTIEGGHLQRIQTHILWSRIYLLGAEVPTMRRPRKLHLLANPYGTAIRVCNPDGSWHPPEGREQAGSSRCSPQ